MYIKFIIFFSIVYATYIATEKGNFSTRKDSNQNEVMRREKQRGTLVSVISAASLIMFQTLVTANERKMEFRYGFILSPVIGYILDVSFGSDEGLKKIFTYEGVKYTFTKVASFSFLRYIVTVLLDVFISQPLMDAILLYFNDVPNIRTTVQSIVAIITFKLYTNITRFQWAYTSPKVSKDNMIKSSTIKMVTTLASILYLLNNIPGSDPIKERIPVVMFTFMLITIMSFLQADDPTKKDNIGWIPGLVIFLSIFLYGVSPVAERILYNS